MKTSEERIRELARKNAIDDTEAAGLLDAIALERPPSGFKSIIRNPFARFSGEVTSIAGVAIAAFAILLARPFHVRFDGAFDLHLTKVDVSLSTATVDQLVAFPLTALVFWAIVRMRAKGTRFVDILGAVGLSRAPATLLAIPLALLESRIPGPPGKATPVVLLVAVLALGAIGSQIYWLYQGVRTASGIRDGKVTVPFIVSIVVAEVLSKIVLNRF